MAESNAGAPALHTNIESGNFDEKEAQRAHDPTVAKPAKGAEEEDDEDIDALIEDLESQDGNAFDEEEEEEGQTAGAGRVVPEEMLQTDTRVGLTEGKFCITTQLHAI